MSRQKLIEEFLASRSTALYKGGTPKNEKQAAQRFECDKIAGGCTLTGRACGIRHMLAVKRHAGSLNGARAFDNAGMFDARCDKVCSECSDGAARAQLLGIDEVDLRRRAVKRSVSQKPRGGRMSATPAQLTILIQKERFTTDDVMQALQITKWSAAKWCRRHLDSGDIERVGKDGRRWIYQVGK